MQDNNIHNIDDLDLQAVTDEDLALEELPDGNALGTWASAATASSASCPASSASSSSSASSFG
ncbi:thiocillin family RiPP [Yimella sp. cx-573]|nr:thiocillin family RiPP [Yimella sp. cx-573]